MVCNIGLGIDTGGTFTDAVIVEMTSGQVLASAKSPTTRQDLAIGILGAVRQLPEQDLHKVGLVSLSTTLATNAAVEGNGSPICLVLIGYDEGLFSQYQLQKYLPTANIVFIRGGHDFTGNEKEPLDETALYGLIREQSRKVDAFAVSGFFGIRNPEHEIRARDIIRKATGLPVTCGHELTSELDSVLRAATCALNASLIPLLRGLMLSVQQALHDLNIKAPLMVVRGDGSLMKVELALTRPVETIMSGPAASVVGAQNLTGLQDMVVVDVGGTTTDLAIVRNGLPALNEGGANVGRWRTLVRAVQTVSIGLGGDSRVYLDDGLRLKVGPRRVLPLSYLAKQQNNLISSLEQTIGRITDLNPMECDFFTLLKAQACDGYSAVEQRLISALANGPLPLWQLTRRDPWAYLYLTRPNRLEATGVIMRCGFTPTDALHILGYFNAWDEQAAVMGAKILGYFINQEAETIAKSTLVQAKRQLIGATLNLVTGKKENNGNYDFGGYLFNLGVDGSPTDAGLGVQLQLKLPITGIGAPAQHMIVPAGQTLNTPVHLPRHYSVANAVGAISGSVVTRAKLEVQPIYRASGLEGYIVTGNTEKMSFTDKEPAILYAREKALEMAQAAAEEAGAADYEVRFEVNELEGSTQAAFGSALYLGSAITAIAIGRPKFAGGNGNGNGNGHNKAQEALW